MLKDLEILGAGMRNKLVRNAKKGKDEQARRIVGHTLPKILVFGKTDSTKELVLITAV